MAKLTDARVVTLKGFYDAGDQPTAAQFAQLIQYIQEGIEEHDHDGTGDGDGIAAIGITGITGAGVDVLNGWYIGIGAALERLVFSTAGYITVLGAKFGVNVAVPSYTFDIRDDIAAFIGFFYNDGNNDNRTGIMIQCGADTNPAASLALLRDGNATNIGNILGDGAGGVTYWSASDERLKNILGPIDSAVAMKALVEIDPIQYVGKGLTAKTGRKNLGFAAQEIHKHFPEVATYDEEEDLYGMSYERLVPVLWAQNQALLKRIEQLEAR